VTRSVRQSAVTVGGLMRGDPVKANEAKAMQASKKKKAAKRQ
jgi:hypothetical protein